MKGAVEYGAHEAPTSFHSACSREQGCGHRETVTTGKTRTSRGCFIID